MAEHEGKRRRSRHDLGRFFARLSGGEIGPNDRPSFDARRSVPPASDIPCSPDQAAIDRRSETMRSIAGDCARGARRDRLCADPGAMIELPQRARRQMRRTRRDRRIGCVSRRT
jgi:hypothetical protein